MSEAEIKTTHKGIEIVYLEGRNQWQFTKDGIERKMDTLASAKAFIDRPPKKLRAPFKRFEAYVIIYGVVQEVEVTSTVAESYGGNPRYVWTSAIKGKERRQYAIDSVYPKTPHNTALVERWKAVQAEIENLEREKNKAQSRMKVYEGVDLTEVES